MTKISTKLDPDIKDLNLIRAEIESNFTYSCMHCSKTTCGRVDGDIKNALLVVNPCIVYVYRILHFFLKIN